MTDEYLDRCKRQQEAAQRIIAAGGKVPSEECTQNSDSKPAIVVHEPWFIIAEGIAGKP